MEQELDKDILYHYCFNINDMALSRFGVGESQLLGFKMLLLTTLAQEVAEELNDNWLIVQGKEKHVLIFDEKSHINENDIITYYMKTEKIPEDTLYLGEHGIELYSRNVDKIENHKTKLEKLSENIQELVVSLIEIENKQLKDNNKEEQKIETIQDYINKWKDSNTDKNIQSETTETNFKNKIKP